jgi:hypothetical protein
MPVSPAEPGQEEGAPQEPAEEAAPAAEEGPPEDGPGGEDLEAIADQAVDEVLTTLGLTTPGAEAFDALRKATGEGGDPAEWKDAINEVFELGEDGKPTLKLDAAARRMSQASGQEDLSDNFDIPAVDEEGIRAEALAEAREFAKEYVEADDMDSYLKAQKPQIEKRVNEKLTIARNDQQNALLQITARVAQVGHSFFESTPDAKKYGDKIDSWFRPMKKTTVARIMLEDPGILRKIYEAEKLREEIRPLLKKVWNKAKEPEGQPTDAGASRTGGRAPRGRAPDATPEDDTRSAILGAGRDSVLGRLTGGQ